MREMDAAEQATTCDLSASKTRAGMSSACALQLSTGAAPVLQGVSLMRRLARRRYRSDTDLIGTQSCGVGAGQVL